MKKRLTRIAPLRAGIMLACLYGMFGLIFLPIFIFATRAIPEGSGSGMGIIFAVTLLIFYAFGGFVAGIIFAALYNLIAKLTGGLQFEVSDDVSES